MLAAEIRRLKLLSPRATDGSSGSLVGSGGIEYLIYPRYRKGILRTIDRFRLPQRAGFKRRRLREHRS